MKNLKNDGIDKQVNGESLKSISVQSTKSSSSKI